MISYCLLSVFLAFSVLLPLIHFIYKSSEARALAAKDEEIRRIRAGQMGFDATKFSKLLSARHSVRSFSDMPVKRELIDSMIEDATLAPSSRNCKSSGFMIIEDPAVLEALSEMRDYGSALIKGAAAAIVVLGDETKTDLWVDNAAISATYLLLSAVDKGLGACWVHINGRQRVKDDASAGTSTEYVRDLLGIKDGMHPYCVIAIGYEAGK